MIAQPMPDLAALFADAVRHTIARAGQPEQEPRPGIDWIWAANGIFKRASSAELSLQACVNPIDYRVPGLANLLPYVRWAAWPRRLPGGLLGPLLRDAQQAGAEGADSPILRPIEKQYFIVHRDNDVRLVAPRAQEMRPGSVRYTMPAAGIPLLDIHSHHAMQAYFSPVDDHDDQGLSLSAVIGQIYTRPEIAMRMNIYGHHCPISALTVFDGLGPFVDRYPEGDNRDAR